MDTATLEKLIKEHQPLSTRKFDQKSYKIGVNAGIFQEANKPAPDNRIPVPFIRRAVKITKGYFAKVGNITYESDWFEKNLSDIYDANDEELETAAVFEDSITYGSAFELHWYNEDGFQFGVIPVDQCIPIYSDDLKPKLIAFIWHRKTRDGSELATYYDAFEYQEFLKNGDKWGLVAERSGSHLYGAVPVLEANTDRDKRNLFDHVLPMLDFFDKLISEVGNEHQKFAESLLLFRNKIDAVTKDENGKTDLDKIAEWRLIDNVGEKVRDAAAYLERNVNDTFIDHTLDRFERLIYEMLCLFNPNDDKFATASGIAQAYKLLGFELMIADMESYFSNFLNARIRLIAGHKTSGMGEGADSVTVKFRRNLPFDVENMVKVATLASGGERIMSNETILKLFPSTIVENVDEEVEKLSSIPRAPLSNPIDRTLPGDVGMTDDVG